MKQLLYNFIRKYDIWYKWHSRICMKLHYTGWKNPAGIVERKGFLKWLHKLQLPICQWLDDIEHQ